MNQPSDHLKGLILCIYCYYRKVMKVLTFNCWAIGYVPFMTKDRKQRVTAIAQYLAKGSLILESFFTLTNLKGKCLGE